MLIIFQPYKLVIRQGKENVVVVGVKGSTGVEEDEEVVGG